MSSLQQQIAEKWPETRSGCLGCLVPQQKHPHTHEFDDDLHMEGLLEKMRERWPWMS